MISRFSERHNLCPNKLLQKNNIDKKLRTRLWNLLKLRESVSIDYGGSKGKVEILLDSLGIEFEYPEDGFGGYNNVSTLRDVFREIKWNEIYDLLEEYIALHKNVDERKDLMQGINKILEEEKSAYRVIDGLVTPIVDEVSVKSLEKSLSTKLDAVDTHMKKALALYSDRSTPDYENSIKESITAVESMCAIITNSHQTLGKTLGELKKKGVYIHPSLELAFEKLYGYASDSNGIRHGGIDFKNAPAEDAYFMLVSCSAFINYLKVKYSKVNNP